MLVMCHGRHLRRGDALAAVEGGKDLAQGNHLAADAGFLFHQGQPGYPGRRDRAPPACQRCRRRRPGHLRSWRFGIWRVQWILYSDRIPCVGGSRYEISLFTSPLVKLPAARRLIHHEPNQFRAAGRSSG